MCASGESQIGRGAEDAWAGGGSGSPRVHDGCYVEDKEQRPKCVSLLHSDDACELSLRPGRLECDIDI